MSLVSPVRRVAEGWWQRPWTLDLRSLACLRISYGLIMLLDLASRACDLKAHYTDWGAVPRAEACTLSTDPWSWSIHLMSGEWAFQAVLFSIAATAALAVMVGYKTSKSTLLAWFMLVSLHTRNAVVLDGGDVYLRCVLFWCIFLPWGARWSWDSRHSKTHPPNAYTSVATLGYLSQFTLVYWLAVALKTGAEWRVEGSAVYYALSLEQFSTSLGSALLAYPALMKFLCFATLAFEALGPLLIWLPGRARILGFLGFFFLHMGFGSCMYLGLFTWIGAITPIGFLPGELWDRLERRLGISPRPSGTSLEQPHPLLQTMLATLLLLVVYWNLGTIPTLRLPLNPPGQLLHLLRLDQNWTMFAPKPLIEDGWYVVEAEQRDGTKVDILRNAPVDWSKPSGEFLHYRNARWRKLMMNLWDANLVGWRAPFGCYLTRAWNDSHAFEKQILRFRIYFMLERTLAQGTAPVERKMIWEHRCFDYVK